MDPLADDYISLSPYNYVLNNPLSTIDPDGRGVTSTHTDSSGNVLAVFNDGDNGVYRHRSNATTSSIEAAYTANNTSAGGTKMGETEFWDEFAKHNMRGHIIGDKSGNFANKKAQIQYDVSLDQYMNTILGYSAKMLNWFAKITDAKDWLATQSGPGGDFDIKRNLGGENKGYLLNGKYVTGESAGNYLFGANLRLLKESSFFSGGVSDNYIFDKAARVFGALHNKSNNVNNPVAPPYYGEIPYSGRQVVLGYYYNNVNNNIFRQYKNAALYGLKVKK